MQLKPIHYTKDVTVFQLRAARYALGITRNEIIKKTGVSSSTLSMLENEPLFSAPTSLRTSFTLRGFYESKGIIFFEDNAIKYDPAGDGVTNFIFHIEEANQNSTIS